MRSRFGHYALVAEVEFMTVLSPTGETEQWTLDLDTIAPHHAYRLTVGAPDGRNWTAEDSDVFACLSAVREQVEPVGYRLCCNGARRDAWASGMQRDMGGGIVVYLLADVIGHDRPPQVETLAAAPPDAVCTVAEQRSWHDSWLASREGPPRSAETTGRPAPLRPTRQGTITVLAVVAVVVLGILLALGLRL
jgi:hypothetical protein